MLHWAYQVNAYFFLCYVDLVDFVVFARLYLLCRAVTYHSRFLRDSSSQSLGCLNQVPIDFFFIIKAYLEQSPAFCLMLFFLSMFAVGSWSLRACDYTADRRHLPIGNATWLFLTLFTTVGESFLISFPGDMCLIHFCLSGYGDLTPSTYCGRGMFLVHEL